MGGKLGEEFSNLSRLDDGQLADSFQRNRDDPRFLEALNEVLKRRDSDEAIALQFDVVNRVCHLAPSRRSELGRRFSGYIKLACEDDNLAK
jgi:hypothetical protein